ncbi:MAG: YidC/Oxa1 family membrane protein insertase [Ruminococcaceae bacterium]|nr:YidC/Oxa1 family membrane protein insertase [Oscillospiraceae bacterium]
MAILKNRSLKRIITLLMTAVTMLALVISLTACGGGPGKIGAKSEKESDVEFIARAVANTEALKIRFVAASRGYDITAEGFDDSTVDNTIVNDPDMEAIKATLLEVAEKNRFKDSDDHNFVERFADSVTAEQVNEIVKEMSIEYDFDTDHGFPSILLVWIGKALGWMTGIFGNQYVIAIMVFAVFVEILMLPMAVKQQKNSVGMAKLRPKIARIEKKYAGRNDQVTLRKKQEEIAKLQQDEGYSPFSGCLPMLIQLIIVGFVLYPIIQNPLRYVLDTSEGFSQALVSYATSMRAVGGLGIELGSKGNVIELLSMLDGTNIEAIKDFPLIVNGAKCYDIFVGLDIPKFELFGLNIGRIPKVFDILVIVPILNVVLQWGSMVLTRKWMGNSNPAMDGQAKSSMMMMDITLPLMTLFIMFQVPALIGIYWLFRSLLSLLKSYIMKRIIPIPVYTEEELKEIEKAEKERKKAEQAIMKTQPKVKSLHYIDADDYDELPEVKGGTGDKKPKSFSSDKPEIKD